jgi:hypothetical protein
MGEAEVPMSKVPPGLTVTLPPTTVKLLEFTRLKIKFPFMVVARAVAVVMSRVTVSPERMVTVSAAVGTPAVHVAARDQKPFPFEVIAAARLPLGKNTARGKNMKNVVIRADFPIFMASP